MRVGAYRELCVGHVNVRSQFYVHTLLYVLLKLRDTESFGRFSAVTRACL